MNLFVERDGKRIFAVSTRNNYGEAKLEILLEVECICSDDDDLLVVFYKSYQNVKYELQEESQTLFQRAVQDDTNRRIKDLGDAFVFPIQALIDWNEIALQSRLPMRLYI